MTYVKAAAMQQNQLTPQDKAGWNSFVDFLDKKGMKGNPALDNRNTGLSQQLFNQYKAQDPSFTLTYDKIPQIQAEMQKYRNDLVNKWKADPSIIPGIKSEDEIMGGGVSPVDGWLGSKTSSHKYPIATLNNNGQLQNYGTDLSAYQAAIANTKKSK